jgi:hypothetical protein
VEDALERGGTLSKEIVEPEPPVASNQQLQQLVLNSLMQRRQAEIARVEEARSGMSDLVAEASAGSMTEAGQLAVAEPNAALPTPGPSSSGMSGFDRFLLGAGSMAIVVTGAAWVFTHGPGHEAAKPGVTASAPTPNAFGEYVKQSLQAIAAKSPLHGVSPSPTSSPTTAQAPSPTTVVPSVVVPGTVKPGAPAPTAPPRVATGLSRLVPPAPVPGMQPPAATAPIAPAAPGFMASGTPLPPSGSATTSVTPGVVRSLVGVMQLGDRSAALVEMNGVAQRVRIGESIGASGWTLVEVSKDQAVIRRNGEVRTIFIGQTF